MTASIDKLVTINRVAKVVKGGRRFALLGAGRGRRPQGSRRLRQRQGARGAGGDPQGDRAGQARHDPRAAAGGPHAASRHRRPLRRRQGGAAHRRRRHRHHRRRADARGVRDAGHRRRGGKSLGSRNPHNMVKATFAALQRCASPRSVATRRGKKVAEILGRREPHRRAPPRQGRRPPVPKVRVTQTASAGRPQARPEGDAGRARPEQAAPQPRAGGYALGPRQDRQGAHLLCVER